MALLAQDIKILSKKGHVIPIASIQEFKGSFDCDVVIKDETSEEIYRAAIDRWNKAFVAEAEIVVFCKTEQDIAACLAFIQKYDLPMVISSGRHSYYGASSIQGGLVIDLRNMKGVSIDEEGMSITAQGGCRAIDLETPLQELGLSVVLGAVNDTGIGGLTLGGGSGYLSGQYGLAIDNLLGAKVVLANGHTVTASETENADLFWCLRGGGSNFGIVTEFKYRLHEQDDVFFGPLVFTPDKVRLVLILLPKLREIAESDKAAGQLALFVVFMRRPPMSAVHPVVLVFYDGPADAGNALLAPLLELGPVANMVQMKKYADVTFQPAIGSKDNEHHAATSMSLFDFDNTELLANTVAGLGRFLDKYGETVDGSKIVLEIRSHMVTGSVDPASMALRAREKGTLITFGAQHDGSVVDANKVMRAELQEMMSGLKKENEEKYGVRSRFVNSNIGGGEAKLQDMYGENLDKLRELKRKFDPEFVFDKWYPIPPAVFQE